jgi:Rifampin ADP-ribosyl transferase
LDTIFKEFAEKAREKLIMASESVSVSDPVDIEATAKQLVAAADDLSLQRFYHGTRADLKPGNLIEPGYHSNYGKRKQAAYVYLTATLDQGNRTRFATKARDYNVTMFKALRTSSR